MKCATPSCEMANGVVPYSDFPSTLMLIEKLRGSSPRLLDFATLSAAQNQVPKEHLDFTSSQAILKVRGRRVLEGRLFIVK